MPTVNGKWKWNDTIASTPEISAVVNFQSNGRSYNRIDINNISAGPAPSMLYGSANQAYDFSGWQNEAYKIIDFGSSTQEVSQNFYDYLTANATKQEEPVVPTTTKTVSSDNLARFKQKCDETYAAIGNIPTVSTELVNLGTLSTSGTLTADQATQIGTTTVGVTARASVNSVTRFYERVNISGTTATLVSADDDALHVLTVNLSTRAYTLSDVALGGGSGPEIPTPTTADNGKVLGVANGAYSLLNLFPVGAYYITESLMTPASLFGGEWVRVEGKFLIGESLTNGLFHGTEGGEKTHTLTTEEMPQHAHKPHQYTWIVSYGSNSGKNAINAATQGNANIFNADEDQNRYTGTAGGNQPHNNMPPYRVVYIWRRTA